MYCMSVLIFLYCMSELIISHFCIYHYDPSVHNLLFFCFLFLQSKSINFIQNTSSMSCICRSLKLFHFLSNPSGAMGLHSTLRLHYFCLIWSCYLKRKSLHYKQKASLALSLNPFEQSFFTYAKCNANRMEANLKT